MNYKTRTLLYLFLSVVGVGFCGDTATLHPYYEQNGDCYVLVGGDNDKKEYRAVWALNNLFAAKKPDKLFDPEDAYGITAAQSYNSETDKITKRLYIFSGVDSGLKDITGEIRGRAIIPTASYNVWTGTNVPTATVHRYHTNPDSGESKLGNHTKYYVDNLFAGQDYPCNVYPLKSTGKTDAAGHTLYEYKVGHGYYHTFNEEVYSPYTYRSYGGYAHRMIRERIQEAERDIKLYKYKKPDSAPSILKKISDSSVYESKSDIAVVTTKVEGKKDLNGECCDGCIAVQRDVDMPGVPSPVLNMAYSAQVDTSYLYNRAFGTTDYTLSVFGRANDDKIIGNGADITCNYIGISSKNNNGNYVYLLGSNVINQWMKDSSCPTSMYIDNADDLSGIAVSDQWWQTGGIVYAYDKKKGKVYSFVRVETVKYDENGNLITSGPPDEIDVAFDGVKPDKIGCDGFGNLYMLKTEYDPTTKDHFGKDGKEAYRRDTGDLYGGAAYQGKKIFEAVFEQGVYKTVYKKPYGSEKIEKVKNRIELGKNAAVRRYVTEDDKIDSDIIWIDKISDMVQIKYADDPNRIRTELAVINCPTPPRPDHLNATTDCVGPMILTDTGFKMATPGSDGLFTSDTDLFFMVENAPYFDANNLNIGNSDEDIDGDGRVGCFPNTIKKELTKYYWKIRRTHDREGNKVDKYATENQILETEGDYILYFPSLLEGKFEVGVKVSYGYYDYSDLPVGALSSDREKVLKTGFWAKGEDTNVDEDKYYSWQPIGQRIVEVIPSSEDRGVIMTSTEGIKVDETTGKTTSESKRNFKPGSWRDGYKCNYEDQRDNCGHEQCKNNVKLPKPTEFIMDGYSLCKYITIDGETNEPKIEERPLSESINWAMLLRDTAYNTRPNTSSRKPLDRVDQIANATPPDPNDPSMVPGTLKWLDADSTGANNFTVQWFAELEKNGKTIWSNTVLARKTFGLTLSQIRSLMPIPSDPMYYKIRATVSTKYTYEYYARIPIYIGGTFTGNYKNQRIPKIKTINLYGEALVCVTDNTGPGLYQYNPVDNSIVKGYAKEYSNGGTEKFFIKAATGEELYDQGIVSYYVVDNNPMGDYTGSGREVVLNAQDSYHYNPNDSKLKRLVSSFNSANRKAIFHYDSNFGDVPYDCKYFDTVDNTILNYYTYSPATSLNQDRLKKLGITLSDTFSYTKYDVNLSKLNHLSKNKDGSYSRKFNYEEANNKEGYKNKKFGLVWKEACYSNQNKELSNYENYNFYKNGNIVIIDNDRPNAFIKARQDRFPDYEPQVPSEIPSGAKDWFPSVLDINSGPINWFKEIGFGERVNKECFSNWKDKMSSEPKAETMIFDKEHVLLTDVPVTFFTLVNDNITPVNKITYNYFVLKHENGSTTDLPEWNKIGDTPMIQHVFRTPGKYYVELSIKDDALTWPTVDNALNSPSVADKANQGRIVRAYFEVVASKLEYRVLERDINGDY